MTWLQILSLENVTGKLSPISPKNIYKLRLFFSKAYTENKHFYFHKNMKKYIYNTRAIIKSNLRSCLSEKVTKNVFTLGKGTTSP